MATLTRRSILESNNDSDWQLPTTICIAVLIGVWGLIRVAAGISLIVSSKRLGTNFDYLKTKELTAGFYSVFSRLVEANPDARWDQWLTSESLRKDISQMYDNTTMLKKLHSPTSFGQNNGDLYQPKKLDEVVDYVDAHKDCLWFTTLRVKWENLLARTVADVTSAYTMLAAVQPSLIIGHRYWNDVYARHPVDKNETDVTNYYSSGCCNRYMPWKCLLAVLAWKQQNCAHCVLPLVGDITGSTRSFEYQEIPRTIAVKALVKAQWLTAMPVGMMLLQTALLISTPITYNKFGHQWRVYEVATAIYIILSIIACYIVDAYTSYKMLGLRIVDNSIKFIANAIDPVFEQSNVPKHVEIGWNKEGAVHIQEWVAEAEENANSIPKIQESQQIASTTATTLFISSIGLQAIAMASSTRDKEVVNAVLALIVTLQVTATATFNACIINMVVSLRALTRQVELHKLLLAHNPYSQQSEEAKAACIPMTENESKYVDFENRCSKDSNNIGSIAWYNSIAGLTVFQVLRRCVELSLFWEYIELWNIFKSMMKQESTYIVETEERTNSIREMLRRSLCMTAEYMVNPMSEDQRLRDALLWNRIISQNTKLEDKVHEIINESWNDDSGIRANIYVLELTFDDKIQEGLQKYTFYEYANHMNEFKDAVMAASVELLGQMLYQDGDDEGPIENNTARQQGYLARTSSIIV